MAGYLNPKAKNKPIVIPIKGIRMMSTGVFLAKTNLINKATEIQTK